MSALMSATAAAAATPPRLPQLYRRTHRAMAASSHPPNEVAPCLWAPVCVAHLNNATPRRYFVFELQQRCQALRCAELYGSCAMLLECSCACYTLGQRRRVLLLVANVQPACVLIRECSVLPF